MQGFCRHPSEEFVKRGRVVAFPRMRWPASRAEIKFVASTPSRVVLAYKFFLILFLFIIPFYISAREQMCVCSTQFWNMCVENWHMAILIHSGCALLGTKVSVNL